ncbi:MAG: T9SS type A sorting domain-containing protein [Flavobacteriales bacterium]|nr:T9SS type A sorting domain-containing protein [Flavobacteriales bacterium]
MRYFIFFLSFIFVFNSGSKAQFNYDWHDNVVVLDNLGDTLDLPWAGGFNAPQFSNIDLNRDGVNDLFVFDRDHNVIKTFIKTGGPGDISYEYAPEYRDSFPTLSNFVLLADYNCDGEKDIFTFKQGGAGVYRNDYLANGQLSFTLVTDPYIKYPFGNFLVNAYVSTVDIPAIEDIDGDGDLDLLSFEILGSYVGYYRNMSMETYGHCDSLNFIEEAPCWGNFREAFGSNALSLGVSCPNKAIQGNGNTNSRHAGSTLLALNVDANDSASSGGSNYDMEILIGDVSFSNLSRLMNGWSADSADMVSQDSLFPVYDQTVDLSFPAAFYVDIDGDDNRDLIASTNSATNASAPSENVNNVWYYQNIGADDSCHVAFQMDDFLQKDMIEVGSHSDPAFLDYNADNKADLVIGTYGYFDTTSSTYISKLTLYENVGTSLNPSFQYITDDYANVSSLGLLNITPCFGDLDGDGDQDMIIGDINGQVHFYENLAGSSSTANFVLSSAVYKGIDVGSNANPTLYDLNNDNLIDLIIGEENGTLKYFENIGTSSVPDFSSTATNTNLGGIKVGQFTGTGHSAPVFVKDNGVTILYLGDTHGYLHKYGNIDNNLQGNFLHMDSVQLNSGRIGPAVGKLFGNNNDALIYGEAPGGLGFLKDNSPVFTNHSAQQSQHIQVFPNPASHELYIKLEKPLTNIRLIDILGKTLFVETQRFENFAILDVGSLNNGSYILEVNEQHRQIIQVDKRQ